MGDENVKNFKILGQEPAALVGIVEAALLMLLTFGVSGLDQDTVGVIVAAVAAGLGFVTAYATKTTLYSALVGLAKALLILAVTFGAPLSDAQTGSILAFIMILAGAYLREKTSSVDTPISNASPASTNDGSLNPTVNVYAPGGDPAEVYEQTRAALNRNQDTLPGT